jgi:hypothetical protein
MYSNRQVELIKRRQNDMLEQRWKNDMDALNRGHARKLQAADDLRIRELDLAKRKKHDMKVKWKKYDSSLLEAAEKRLSEVSTAITDFVPRMEHIADCHRFKAAMLAKPPPKRMPIKKKTLPQRIQSVPAPAHPRTRHRTPSSGARPVRNHQGYPTFTLMNNQRRRMKRH